MGKGRDDRHRAKEHKFCLRWSFWIHDPQRDTWPPAPSTQGRKYHQRIETSTKERENKLPTSNLHPKPATSTAHGHPPLRERKPQAHTEPSLGTAERGWGLEFPPPATHPWGLVTPKRCWNPFPGSSVPSYPFVVCPRYTQLQEKAKAG